MTKKEKEILNRLSRIRRNNERSIKARSEKNKRRNE